ncbi:DUF397 domain-containing protein [Streptomyces sp. NPDC050738]|uniref:DUF397 domain-containing protein n=1 Tax=Streptomyces sp. NPDC050738 TaxID=3154744 RepID=UPI003443E607
METNQSLTAATWRKSSYSGDTGGQCVEVAELTAGTGTDHVAVRDSKNLGGGAFTVTTAAFSAFVRGLGALPGA